MSNNLYKVEKDLRSIAKRYKSIKYSLSLVILFLMMGLSAFSEEVNNVQVSGILTREQIASSRESIKSSIGSLHSKINQAKTENEKGLTGLRLELIQLMEQGDQVVKSPWASWQFGANYIYNKWNGTYKGKGDKAQKYPFEGIFTRESGVNEMNRYISDLSSFYSSLSKSTDPRSASSNARQGLKGYGIASNIPVPEPIVDLELNAAIDTKVVNKADLNLVPKTANIPTLPEPVRFSPINPNIVPPDDPALPVPPTFSVILGADCNSNCNSNDWRGGNGGITTPRQRSQESFLNALLNNPNRNSNQNTTAWLHYTWRDGSHTPAEQSYAFKMYAEETTTDITNPRGSDVFSPSHPAYNVSHKNTTPSGNTYYFNSYNFGNEFRDPILDPQDITPTVNKNRQYFFIGGSRFWEIDNATSGTFTFPSGKTLSLGGILTLGMVAQENGTTLQNAGKITDVDEKNEKYIQNMPYDTTGEGARIYKTIYGPANSIYKVKRSEDGYVGYKVGIAQVQENGGRDRDTNANETTWYMDGHNQILINAQGGEIDFRGERSIGMYAYLPDFTSWVIMKNSGTISLSGSESYGMKLAARTASRAEMTNEGTINLRKNPDGKDKANNSAGMALMEDTSVRRKVNLDSGKAKNTGTINLTDVQNSSGTYINVDSDITNDTTGKINVSSTIAKTATNQAVNVGMRADKGTGNGGTNKATVINKGIISLDGSFAIGMLANGAKLNNSGTIITTANKTISNGIGIAAVNNANIENTGTIKIIGTGDTNNIGVYLKGSTGTVGATGTPSIDVSGNKSIGVFTVNNNSTISTLTMRGNVKVSGNGISGIVAKGGSQITLNGTADITVNNNGSVSSPIGTRGSYGVVVQGSSSKFMGNDAIVNVKITNPESIGLYSEGNLTVNKANITAVNGALNLFANNGKIEIKNGGTTETGQKSLLFYTSGANANIKLSGGTLNATIKGGSTPSTRGTAFYYEGSGNTFDKTAIENYFKTVFGDGANSTLGHLNLNMEAGSRLFVASKVKMDLTNTAASKLTTGLTGGPNITGSNYKTFMLYLSELTVDNIVNLDNATDPYNELEIANSSIINKNTMSGSKNRQVAMAQENGKDTHSVAFPASQVKLTNDVSGKINLTGEETTGMYVKRGQIDNKGEISIGKKSTAIYLEDDDLGISATEGTVTNSGKITLGENSTGIYFKNGVSSKDGGVTNNGKIGSSANNVIAMTFDTGSNTKVFKNGTAGEINLTGDKSTAMYATGAGAYTAENVGKITLGNSANANNPNVAMFTAKSQITLKNSGKIIAGNKSVGLYGYGVDTGASSDISTGEGATGIYSKGGNVTLNGKMTVGKNDAVGVYTVGSGQTITNNATNINIGDGSYGFVNKQAAGGNSFISNTTNVTVGNNVVYTYSIDTKGTVTNKTTLTSTGSGNYGLYSAGIATNDANINFGTGTGNVGVYSIKNGTVTNLTGRSITVGGSDPDNNKYGIGMAAGYEKTDFGNIINKGTINVNGKNSIGMYATGSNSTVINDGTINLRTDGTVGIYLDNGAKGINNGSITTVGNPKGVTGVAVRNGAEFTNNGTIHINSAGGQAYFRAKGGIIRNYGTFTLDGGAVKEHIPGNNPTGKEVGGVDIEAPAGVARATIKRNGKVVTPVTISNVIGQRAPLTSSIGMYVDTLRGTNPIGGLIPAGEADLIVGSEASKITNSKDIEINGDILKPYNKAIARNPQITKWKIYSGAFTWIATGTIDNATQQIKNLYLSKIPYTKFAGNEATPVDKKDTYNFLDGLEQRYGIETIGTKENGVFQKLNGIGNNEKILFYQAVDEMMGHQYANVQQRVQATGVILDKEFNYLRDEWRTASKDSNKIKTFGTNGEYKTNTAGVINYKYNAYGVAYVHENEDIKLGRGIGWYTGIVHNTFKFKDIGNSKEQMLQGKVGIFKSVPFDDNNSLNWTISGDIFYGYNKMHRKFLVVDEVFNAKAKYHTYGIGIKNEIGKEFRLSEGFTLRPYGALKLEY